MKPLYLVIGALLIAVAWHVARDERHPRRWASGAFWALLALLFVGGDALGPHAAGAIAVALAALAGAGRVVRGPAREEPAAQRAESAARLGHRLFGPALAIPAATVLLVLALKHAAWDGRPLLEPQIQTLWALALACLLAGALALRLTRRGPADGVHAARDLLEAIGWAGVLPLMLAALGAVFAAAGVGDLLARGVSAVIPVQSAFACVAAYAIGMALFTMLMGNAFAAFPVMTAGVGLPLLVRLHGADPASMAAIGMLSGYCGTLLTPMAANFNIVPAALLELKDPHAVIRAQAPTGLVLLAVNVALMYAIVFR